MSADWQPGDLAIFVGHKPDCITCITSAPDVPCAGVNEVIGILRNMDGDTIGTCGLLFAAARTYLCSCGFRKADKHESCSAEFLASICREKADA